MNNTKRCTCGNSDFLCHSLTRARTLVNETRDWVEDDYTEEFAPFGPYECANCGKTYQHWSDIPDAPRNISDEDKRTQFDAVFVDTPSDSALKLADMVRIAGLLDTEEVLPLTVKNRRCSSLAIGFISKEAANGMERDYSDFLDAVRRTMEQNVNYEGIYLICGEKVLLTDDLKKSIDKFDL